MLSRNEVINRAGDIVTNAEDRFLHDSYKSLRQMRRRAEASNTNIAWQEFNSAVQAFIVELERLDIDIDEYNFEE